MTRRPDAGLAAGLGRRGRRPVETHRDRRAEMDRLADVYRPAGDRDTGASATITDDAGVRRAPARVGRASCTAMRAAEPLPPARLAGRVVAPPLPTAAASRSTSRARRTGSPARCRCSCERRLGLRVARVPRRRRRRARRRPAWRTARTRRRPGGCSSRRPAPALDYADLFGLPEAQPARTRRGHGAPQAGRPHRGAGDGPRPAAGARCTATGRRPSGATCTAGGGASWSASAT